MNNKTYFTVHAVIYAIFAIVLFFLPTHLWPMYGVEINDQYANFLSQHNSIFLGGIAAFSFLFRNTQEKTESAINLIKGLIFTNSLGLVITLYACINGIFSGFGWSDPIFFGFLACIGLWQLKKNS